MVRLQVQAGLDSQLQAMQKKEEDVLVSLIIFVKNIVFFTHKQHILYSLFCVSYSEASFFPVFLSFCHFHLFSVLLSFHLYSTGIKTNNKNKLSLCCMRRASLFLFLKHSVLIKSTDCFSL